MAHEARLRLTVHTPHEVALRAEVDSLRVPTESGQVGLRPGAEGSLLVVEPGLVLVRESTGVRFVATAGGLLRHRDNECTLFTPVAVVGSSADEVRRALDRVLSVPTDEMNTRRQLGRLEQRILDALRGRDGESSALGRENA